MSEVEKNAATNFANSNRAQTVYDARIKNGSLGNWQHAAMRIVLGLFSMETFFGKFFAF